MDKYQQTLLLLDRLEAVFKDHALWQSTPPSPEALASVEPFSVDTLSCAEWLQWVFLPKMRHLVESGLPLPASFSIAPYVEEAMKDNNGYPQVLGIAVEFDNLYGPDNA